MSPIGKGGLAVVLFALGLLIGMAIAGLIAWGDMEAALFDAAVSPEAPLTTLRCPVMVTTAQTATVSAAFSNPRDRQVDLYVRAHISNGHVTWMREINTLLPLAAGETQRLEWTVTPADAAFGRVILVRVHVLPNGPLPYRSAACGIVLVDVPVLGGTQALVLGIAAALLLTGSGIALWAAGHRPLIGRSLLAIRCMGVLAGGVGLSIATGLPGWWVLSTIFLLVTVLLAAVVVGYFLTSS